ncbi:50S ribosomal protein L6 [Candidatus Micrarchaeota archaeon]|nr:50S ribosomal protein L6 [Candidatus Micrarchaeota archaeon]MBI5177362.1 50S ribosomal protein L6 [Candidatus Micrarchaeota archaeon]
MKIASGVSVSVSGRAIAVSGPKGAVFRQFNPVDVVVAVSGDEVDVRMPEGKKEDRRAKAMVNAIAAHVRNMMEGVQKGYEKKLTLVYAHFPVTVTEKGGVITVKNFFGEKSPRTTRVVGKETKVKVDKQEVTISGIDKEAVAQTAANLMSATQITKRDRRVFQDGLYLTP